MLKNAFIKTAFITTIAVVAFALVAIGVHASDEPSGTDRDKYNNWQYLGPTGGDVRVIAFDPRDKNRMYLSTVDGQIFVSTDGSRSWQLLANLNQPKLVLDQLFVDPRDSRVIYTSGNRGSDPGGFFKTTDGGQTWKEARELKNEAIHAMAQSAFDPNVLLVGTLAGVWRSRDAGDSWEKLASSTAPVNVDSIAMDPRNLTTMYAGTTWRPYKSTDGGRSWRLIREGMIDDSDVFAISIDSKNPDHIIMSACSGIYESQNAGEKWAKIQGIPSQSRRTRDIMQHPTMPGTVFAATTEGFWMSTNGGKNWALTTQRELEINSIAVHPQEPNRIFLGTNSYGVLESTDGGRNFLPANGNFSNRFTYSLTTDLQQPGRMYAITHNVGTGGGFFFYSSDSGQHWMQTRNLDVKRDKPFVLAQDPQTPNVMYLGTNTGIFRSIDRGESWLKMTAPKPKPKAAVAKRGGRTAAASVKTPPVDPNMPKPVTAITEQVTMLQFLPGPHGGLFAATSKALYKTNDPSKGWTPVIFGNGLDQRVMAMYVNPDRPDTIWAGTSVSGVIVSRDGGTTWEKVGGAIDGVPISSITSDRKRPDYIYVGTISTFYVSRDNGRTWLRRGGNLPLGNYTSILINPNNSDEILVSSALDTDGGIFISTDAGNKWKRVDTKDMHLASRRFWSMVYDPRDPNRVYAGTHSSGVYRIERRGDVAAQGETKPVETTSTN